MEKRSTTVQRAYIASLENFPESYSQIAVSEQCNRDGAISVSTFNQNHNDWLWYFKEPVHEPPQSWEDIAPDANTTIYDFEPVNRSVQYQDDEIAFGGRSSIFRIRSDRGYLTSGVTPEFIDGYPYYSLFDHDEKLTGSELEKLQLFTMIGLDSLRVFMPFFHAGIVHFKSPYGNRRFHSRFLKERYCSGAYNDPLVYLFNHEKPELPRVVDSPVTR